VTTTGNFARTNGVNNCGNSLAVGVSCNIFVTFRPTASGNLTGTVVIASSDPVRPTLTVTTSGVGTFVMATSATLTANRTSPQFPGTTVTFTGAGAGAGVGAVYYYRFSLFNGVAWSVVQPFGTSATWAWPIPLTQMPASYSIQVEVTTNLAGAVADVTQTLTPFTVVQLPPATGVTLTANKAFPQAASGLNVRFTGAGSGSAAAYWYQFLLIQVTSTGAPLNSYLVQDWSTASSWTWTNPFVAPVPTPTAGTYWQVIVNARTSVWQTLPATVTSTTFMLN